MDFYQIIKIKDYLKLIITVRNMNIEKIIQKCLKKRETDLSPQNYQTRTSKSFCSTRKCYQPQHPVFKPSINELPLSIYKPTNKIQCSKEELLQRLTVDKKEQQDKRTYEKIKKQERQFKENCTFMPYLNANSKRIAKTQCSEDGPFQRLYTKAIQKLKTSEALNFSSQNQQQYPFKPQTNYKQVLNDQIVSAKPIHERVQEIVEKKREYLKSLQDKQNHKNLQNIKLNPKSNEIIERKSEFKKNVLDRLQIYWKEQKQRKQYLQEEQQNKLKEKCPFRPQINSHTLLEKDFSVRQQQFMHHLQTKISSQIKEIQNGFKPQINKISQLLTKDERQNQTWQDKINRLHYPNEEKNQKLYEIQQQLYGQCTFEPQINQISRALNAQHKKHRCDHLPKEEEYEFKPKINKLSEHIVKMNKNSQINIKDRSILKQRQALDHVKMELEYKEMKECTFAPKINSSRPKKKSSISSVAGFQNYAKKIQKIQNKKIQNERRNERIFNLEKQYKNRKYTEAKQFNLSQGCNTRRAIKAQVEAQFEKKCTFRPLINEFR